MITGTFKPGSQSFEMQSPLLTQNITIDLRRAAQRNKTNQPEADEYDYLRTSLRRRQVKYPGSQDERRNAEHPSGVWSS